MASQLVVPPDYFAQFLTVIDPSSQAVTGQATTGSAEMGIWIPLNNRLLLAVEDEFSGLTGYVCYDETFTEVFTNTSLPIPAQLVFSPIASNRSNTFYVMAEEDGVPDGFPVVNTLDIFGNVGGTTWTLQAYSGIQYYESMAVNLAETILYYGERPGANANLARIRRHDLLTDTPLSDFFEGGFPNGLGQDMVILADDTLLFAYRVGNSISTSWSIKRYSAAGAELTSYFIGTSFNSGSTPPRFCVEPDELTLWVMSFPTADTKTSRFTQFEVSSGTQLDTFDLPNFLGDPSFAFRQDNTDLPSQCCPIFAMGGSTPPECPGLVTTPRTDGLPYTPPVVDPCLGSGQRGNPRTGAYRKLGRAA